MAQEQPTTDNQPNNFFSFLSLIPKILANPFGKTEKDENGKSVKRVDGGECKTKTPDVVRFPLTQPEVPPLKLDNEDAQDTNPFILWQVYALGGIIVLRWAWGKWQERKGKAKKDSSGEDQLQTPAPAPAAAEDPFPAAAEDPTPAPAED